MALSVDEDSMFKKMLNDQHKLKNQDVKAERYCEGSQRLEHIGLAVPPELRRFETIINVPRMAVDENEHRLDVKSLILPGEEQADAGLRELWDANNLDSEAPLLHRDALTYGRGFATVGLSEFEDETYIRVESPRHMHMLVDTWRRRTDAALRLYREANGRTEKATLYLPFTTIWLERENGGRWVEVARGDHDLGRVPVIMFLNNRKTGDWLGRSEMADLYGMTDSIARTVTNMQLGIETHSLPSKFALGVSKSDFVDKAGNPLPAWEAYFTSLFATENKEARIGQLSASSMENFHSTVNELLSWCATVTGLPTRYMGQGAGSPVDDRAIRADEARLVKGVERKQTAFGDAWGWTMALAHRFKSGEWLEGNRVKVEWHDAGTPTFASRSDAIQKLHGGGPVISREGAWDEMGWSDARKAREKAYFAAEAREGLYELEKQVAEVV